MTTPSAQDLKRASNCIVQDDEEGFYVQATIERTAQALAEERERLLNSPEVVGLEKALEKSKRMLRENCDEQYQDEAWKEIQKALNAFSHLRGGK